MRKNVPGIVKTPNALQCAPNAGKGRQETEKSGMRAVAPCGLVPVTSVQAEEELNVAHGVGQGTEHVAEKEVAELDWVDACEEQAPIAVEEPAAGSLIEVWCWEEQGADG